jgi:putative acetyltransferase
MRIELDDLSRPDVRDLLERHLVDMHATSPPESVHALDPEALAEPDVTFWTAWDGETLVGCGALKELALDEGEIKSMRTHDAARRTGVASRMLAHLVDEARRRGYVRVNLETGSQDYFAPARLFYERHGFEVCPPYGAYEPDPNSTFMTRLL